MFTKRELRTIHKKIYKMSNNAESIHSPLYIGVFLLVVWFSGRVFRKLKIPPMVGEILAGLVLGPHVLDFVPIPEAFALAGELGMSLIMIESGLHIHYDAIKKIGLHAFFIAITGAVLSLAAGVGIGYYISGELVPAAMFIGLVQIPTSVGVALTLLGRYKSLDSEYGQLIITAAFIDDIVALVSLSFAKDWANNSLELWTIALKVLYTTLTISLGVAFSIYVIPQSIEWLRDKIHNKELRHFESHDEIVLVLLFCTAVFLSWVTSLFGSQLLGAFVTGIMFCKVISTHKVWKHQIKRVYSWLKRIFFAATIGFSIPVKTMLSFSAFGNGVLLSACAGIVTKIFPAIFLKDYRWIVGWAMVARGEFGFLMANTFNNIEFQPNNSTTLQPLALDNENYSVVVWSLFITCIISPIVFQHVIERYHKKKTPKNKRESTYRIKVRGERHHSMQKDLADALEEIQLRVKEVKCRHNSNNTVRMMFKATGKSSRDEIKAAIATALGDDSEKVEVVEEEKDPDSCEVEMVVT
jgi:Kef-type K+ transport system membrane component KefB